MKHPLGTSNMAGMDVVAEAVLTSGASAAYARNGPYDQSVCAYRDSFERRLQMTGVATTSHLLCTFLAAGACS